jgi:hypothetical protein
VSLVLGRGLRVEGALPVARHLHRKRFPFGGKRTAGGTAAAAGLILQPLVPRCAEAQRSLPDRLTLSHSKQPFP